MKTDEKDIKDKLRNLKESIEDFLEMTEVEEKPVEEEVEVAEEEEV